jgi:hypothetical protein
MAKQCARELGLAVKDEETPAQKFASVKCPHCGEQTGIGGAAFFDAITMARKECEHCRLEFLLVDDVPVTEEQYKRKSAQPT